MEKLTLATRINTLVKEYPFLIEFLAGRNSRFELLRNKMMRATLGRLATLGKVAAIGDEEPAQLLEALAAEIERQTGRRPEIELAGGEPPADEERLAAMKELIEGLHRGLPHEEAKALFDELIADVSPEQIAELEQQLIREGLPVEEVQRMCDLHVGVFQSGLDEQDLPELPPGHPVHTYLADNRRINELANRLGRLLAELGEVPAADKLARHQTDIAKLLDEIAGVDNHYLRKENQLFPFLEKYGVTGPTQVMWGIHDAIRKLLKLSRQALEDHDAAGLAKHASRLARNLTEMIYKENKILFPLALEKLGPADWARLRRGEDDIGYVLTRPAAAWPPAGEEEPAGEVVEQGLLLSTGELTREQIDLLLTHLPVDVTFVDENDEVRYYTDSSHRIFPRSPAIIGRRVQNCHPPKSVGQVQRILDAFRAGERDRAEFWLEMDGRFIHIRYFAMHDSRGDYRGCLEVSQDLTELRALEGQRRLRDWE